MVSFILSTTFSVTDIPSRRDPFLIFIHQKTKSATGLNIYSIFEERAKTY